MSEYDDTYANPLGANEEDAEPTSTQAEDSSAVAVDTKSDTEETVEEGPAREELADGKFLGNAGVPYTEKANGERDYDDYSDVNFNNETGSKESDNG